MTSRENLKNHLENAIEQSIERGHNVYIIVSANEDIDDSVIDTIAREAKDISNVGDSYDKQKIEDDESESSNLDELLETTQELLDRLAKKIEDRKGDE